MGSFKQSGQDLYFQFSRSDGTREVKLENARRFYFVCNMKTPYPVFLEEEAERKLREQDGE